MKSENLSSNSMFSDMWIKTLLRRSFLLAFVAFMAYFSVCIMPLILSFRHFEGLGSYYEAVLKGGFNFVPFIAGTYAVVLSVMLFNYLHSSSSAAALHSFPVTRGRLYRSTLAAGMLLLLLPVFLTAVVMFALGQFMPETVTVLGADDVMSFGMVSAGNGKVRIDPGEALSLINCLKWFIDTTVGSLFIFAVSNLAGIVAGKDVIHALLACLLNSIVGIICLLAEVYANGFILGSSGTGLMVLAQKSNPFIWYMAERDGMLSLKALPMMAVFVAVTVVLILLTGLLYGMIRLEREQDATVFPVVSDMIVIFCSFCIMSLVGVVSAELAPGDSGVYPMIPFILGCAVGGVPAFIVFRMIADSSVRILNLRTLFTFAAFVAITAAVLAFTCFDITHQTDKVPEPSDVAKVTVHTMKPFDTEVTLSESDSIQAAADLHKVLLNHKDAMSREDYSDNMMQVTLDYKMKNGLTFSRSYNIDAFKYKDVRQAASDFAAGDEYTTQIELYLTKVALNADSSSVDSSTGNVEIRKEDIKPLLMAYLEDYKVNGSDHYYTLAAKDSLADPNTSFTKNRTGTITVSPVIKNDALPDDSMYFNGYFAGKDKHVHKFLKKRGYAKKLIKSEEEYNKSVDEE